MISDSQKALILPGATLGVFGSGQLGRMFAIAARRMGYRVHVFSPDRGTPTGQVADLEISAAYDDAEAIRSFAAGIDVVTYEFENVPHSAITALEDRVPVRPHQEALLITQHRIREKEFLVSKGIPVTPFKRIQSAEDLLELEEQDFPAIMKTASSGYDGKGQRRVDELQYAEGTWNELGNQEVILERLVEFDEELSVVGVRGVDQSFAHYGPLLNRHENHILDLTIVGAELPARARQESVEIARTIMQELDVVGVICIEFFMKSNGDLLVNEIAPRPHNSGHLTIDAHVSCQFEQQVRTICGLPLGIPPVWGRLRWRICWAISGRVENPLGKTLCGTATSSSTCMVRTRLDRGERWGISRSSLKPPTRLPNELSTHDKLSLTTLPVTPVQRSRFKAYESVWDYRSAWGKAGIPRQDFDNQGLS